MNGLNSSNLENMLILLWIETEGDRNDYATGLARRGSSAQPKLLPTTGYRLDRVAKDNANPVPSVTAVENQRGNDGERWLSRW